MEQCKGSWLISRTSENRAAHIIDSNGDTLCRLLSTGGLSPAKYRVADDKGARRICQMCMNVSSRRNH